MTNEQKREYHPVADIFPLMDGDEYDALKADIAANGLLEAIWLDAEGSVIDGRNRHRACLDLDIAPRFRTWDGNGSRVSFIISLNLHRRHLTSSQRAIVGLDMLPFLEAEARERMAQGGGDKTAGSQIFDYPMENRGRASDHAAQAAGTNRQYISDAKRIQKEAPELLDKIRSGEMKITEAKRELVKRNRPEAPPLPPDVFPVIYADPPWSYGNSGIIGDTDNYGHVGRHYPSMTIGELCDLPIKNMVADNAVLFMWVTSPLLAECWPVIKAWGFKYKTSFIWDKVKHNFGHYNSVRHELLLVCTRGSFTPQVNKLFDSVQSVERSDKHSEKPQEFRDIIDTIYPHGPRIELFARAGTDGWATWGNEDDN